MLWQPDHVGAEAREAAGMTDLPTQVTVPTGAEPEAVDASHANQRLAWQISAHSDPRKTGALLHLTQRSALDRGRFRVISRRKGRQHEAHPLREVARRDEQAADGSEGAVSQGSLGVKLLVFLSVAGREPGSWDIPRIPNRRPKAQRLEDLFE